MTYRMVTSKMIGIYAFVAAILFFLLLAVVDRDRTRFSNRVLLRIRGLVHSSQRTHFALYFTGLVFIAVALNLFVNESGDRFLEDAFTWPNQVFIWLNMTALVALYSLDRFRWKRTEEEELDAQLRVLEETVEKAPTPAEGIDHILEYTAQHRDEFPTDIHERFLAYISQREDAIGKEARERYKTFQ